MKTRVILVDDHALTLIGMRYLLSAYDDLRIVAQAQDADGLLAQLEAHPCDLLITDLMMPGSQQADGLRLVQKVRRRYPDLPIIVVTMLGNPALVSSLLKLGIHGLVSKRGMLDDLPKAIRHAGRRPFISRSIAHLLEVGEAEHGKPLASLEQLTPREVEVLRLYGSGLAVGEIAIRLCRSKQTISAQKGSAMRKLGLDSNAGLFIYIRENGLA
ncbi:response regulator transcription factor [Pseudomonas aeruginosa]|uniref:two-component system response regulator TtsR n=1 Tax=Pseudomonas aeruginosa TaxID=287 RepID=UPI00044FCD89|nr:response regulator transcription factor [Pseudomonas aeruginosa]EZO78403.1 two-component system response regulator [Pseudomonas aeruginosa BWH057]EZO85775.1 two-component system response regulator [Pseudomonas aeruginosa BWH056]KAB0753783.1 response regulator transcription factor [Pseudomonas aeruginosa]MBG4347039.1 response regulator transcription factor [Pseudomonas aeruginosa]MBG4909043.1 response regulator transcription factor [Pseudomonas aeruginosa]